MGPRAAVCAGYSARRPGKKPASLAEALAEPDEAKRDAALASLERENQLGLVRGWVRGLRADLAPTGCADALADPLLAASKTAEGASGHVLVGLSLAGKLARTAEKPPAMTATADKEKIKAFIKGPLRTWMVEQATAIEALSASAAGLAGYGRAIAALEAGLADLRLVDNMRSAPVPATWDAELKAVYEAALDEALEPRKARGRDAVLVGLSDMAEAGVVKDPRVERARAMLGKLYGGRRIDALDGLLLPPPPAVPAETAAQRAAAVVPTFWFDAAPAQFPGAEQAAFARGFPRLARVKSAASEGDLPPPNPSLHARARLDVGRLYWRRVDFVEAAHAAKRAGAQDADRLVLAVALACAAGPNGAREMMSTRGGLDRTLALDALASEGGRFAGVAAYDAAYLRALAVPEGRPAASHLRDVAARFRKAESLLTDPAHRKLAGERASEAEAAAKATP